MRRGQQNSNGKQTKALDKAVRKIEGREKEQDQRKGTTGKPVRSTGRSIRNGWKDNA